MERFIYRDTEWKRAAKRKRERERKKSFVKRVETNSRALLDLTIIPDRCITDNQVFQAIRRGNRVLGICIITHIINAPITLECRKDQTQSYSVWTHFLMEIKKCLTRKQHPGEKNLTCYRHGLLLLRSIEKDFQCVWFNRRRAFAISLSRAINHAEWHRLVARHCGGFPGHIWLPRVSSFDWVTYTWPATAPGNEPFKETTFSQAIVHSIVPSR